MTELANSRSEGGFGRLWVVVVREARRRMVEGQRAAVEAFLQAQPEVEAGPQLAKRLGLVPPCLKALEAGVACRQAMFRLSNAKVGSAALIGSPGAVPGAESIYLDAVWIYLSAYVDSCKKFCEAALGQLLTEDQETRARREEVSGWAGGAKKLLSNRVLKSSPERYGISM